MRISGVLAMAAIIMAGAWLAVPAAKGQESQPSIRGTESPADVKPLETGTGAGQPPPPAGGAEAPPPKAPPKQDPFSGMLPLILMIGAFVLLWFWMHRGRGKEQKRRQEMLAALKKGDKITTVGGVIGTVIEVRDDEVMVKVDESANVRVKFARWAIRGVGEGAKAENPQQARKEAPKG